jgi:hypothetical protein
MEVYVSAGQDGAGTDAPTSYQVAQQQLAKHAPLLAS